MAERDDSACSGFGEFAGPWDKSKIDADPSGWIGALSGVTEYIPGSKERLDGYRSPITMSLSSGVPFRIGGGDLYFIGADEGPVKIGFSGNVKSRLRALQHASPATLRILAIIENGSHLERDYHKRFAAHRLHGEWFQRCPEIEAEIERLNTPNAERCVNGV